MSSNIQLQRICSFCGKEFTAKTTVTKCCSDDCAKRAYKARKRAEKIGISIAETQQKKEWIIDDIQAREFLTVVQTSKLIGVSKQSVYKMINAGRLSATNIMLKKTLIQRSDIDKLFINSKKDSATKLKPLEVGDCYTISEVQEKFKVSQSALQKIIKRNSIQKLQKGKFVYVSKVLVDDIFKEMKNLEGK